MPRPKGSTADAPKRRRKAKTTDLAVAIVLDRSSSMGWLTGAVIEGYNEYVNGLREQEGETLFSLTTFSHDCDQPLIGVPIEKVPALTTETYRPNGNTALYDSIAWTIHDLDRRLKAEGREDMKVLVVTITDGEENASSDYDAGRLASLVREYEAKGTWTFVYLGLGQTREYVGTLRGMGYMGENAAMPVASAAGVNSSYMALASATSALRSSAKKSTDDFFGDAGIDPNALPEKPKEGLSESSLLDSLGIGGR